MEFVRARRGAPAKNSTARRQTTIPIVVALESRAAQASQLQKDPQFIFNSVQHLIYFC
jgi:hypothetical protein